VFNFRDDSPQTAAPPAPRMRGTITHIETGFTPSVFHRRPGEPRTIGT